MKGKKTSKLVLLLLIIVSCVSIFAVGCSPSSKTSSATEGDSVAEESTSSAAAIDWTMDTDCSLCHAVENKSLTDSACAASNHGDFACTDCHTDEEGLGEAHDGVTTDSKLPTKLRKSDIDEAVCLTCHGSYETLAALTADSAALSDSEGTTVNPHALPINEDHVGITCSDCHKMHEEKSAADSAKNFCTSCHHMDVFKCHTCHE